MSDFRGLLLSLRGRAALSQRELAAHLGVSERAVQAWEEGPSYPSAASLQRLIALYAARGTFAAGHEAAEAAALWDAALLEAPRFRTPFDGEWFAALPAGRPAPAVPRAGAPLPAAPGAAVDGAPLP